MERSPVHSTDPYRDLPEAPDPASSREQLIELIGLLLADVDALKKTGRRRTAELAELEDRLLAIENSRSFRILRWPGRLWLRWRSRIRHGYGARLHNADNDYALWLGCECAPVAQAPEHQPLLQVALPAATRQHAWSVPAVSSVIRQTYSNWVLNINATAADPELEALARADRRIQFDDGVPAGYVAFLGEHDRLAPAALWTIAQAIVEHNADLVYTDEDHLDRQGRRHNPVFKPAWSPDLVRHTAYPGGLTVVRRELLDRVGWRPEESESDLIPRLAGHVSTVVHIPQVLYHRQKPVRQVQPSPAECPIVSPEIKASIIICSRNAGLLGRCLDGIERNTSHANREIVVVQHHTGHDDAMRRLLENSGATCVPWTEGFHFAAMNNLGAASAQGDVLVFLNDDVQPLTADWLTRLIAATRRPQIGIAGAMLIYKSGAIQHAGIAIGVMQATGHPCRDTFGSPYWKWTNFPRDVSAVTGACMAIRASVFRQLGGFDNAFPVNYNDVDLCLRARQAGYRVVMEPAALLRHDESRTRQPGIHFQERETLEKRWAEWLDDGDPFYTPHLDPGNEAATLRRGSMDSELLHPRVWRRRS